MNIRIRNYREHDLGLVTVLLNAIEAVDQVGQGTTAEELREEFATPEFFPEQNAFVAEDDRGQIVAFGAVYLKHEELESGFGARLSVHPIYRGRGLEDRLLNRLIERAQERLPQITAENVYFSTFTHSAYQEKLRALERAGMNEVRRSWMMRCSRLDNLGAANFPPAFLIRNFRRGEDDEESRDALNAAFRDHWSHADESAERWQHFLNLERYRPDLTVIAEDTRSGRIAGFCHIVVNELENQRLGRQRGWIDILGVRPEYRKQGLGEALILQGMQNLRDARMQEAALWCDSENLTGATRIYFRVGFQVAQTWSIHLKYLRGSGIYAQAEPEFALA